MSFINDYQRENVKVTIIVESKTKRTIMTALRTEEPKVEVKYEDAFGIDPSLLSPDIEEIEISFKPYKDDNNVAFSMQVIDKTDE